MENNELCDYRFIPKDYLDGRFVNIGICCFARYFNMTKEEARKILLKPNQIVIEMIEEFELYLYQSDNLTTKIREAELKNENLLRTDILDL